MATLGRPTVIDAELKERALMLAAEGYARTRIADWLGVSERTLRRATAADAEFAGELDLAIRLARRTGRNPGVARLLRVFVEMLRERLAEEEAVKES